MSWYIEVLRKYAVFKGRARRKEYWFFVLFSTIIFLWLLAIDYFTGSYSTGFQIGIVNGIYQLAVLIPGIAVTVRRLHDTNHSGWWLVSYLIFLPISLCSYLIGFLWALGSLHYSLDHRALYIILSPIFIAFILVFIAFILGITIIVFCILPSNPGENKYGPSPIQDESVKS